MEKVTPLLLLGVATLVVSDLGIHDPALRFESRRLHGHRGNSEHYGNAARHGNFNYNDRLAYTGRPGNGGSRTHRPKSNGHLRPRVYGAYDNIPSNYNYNYAVHDDHSGNHFGHEESQHDYKTEGKYYVHLPDGRIQTVTYHADDTGYHPRVLFEGDAQFGTHIVRLTYHMPDDVYRPK